LNSRNSLDASREEKIQILNTVLQPIVDKAAKRNPGMGLGYYSIELDSTVAVVPFDQIGRV
jgi:hypothetical protein